MSQHFVMPLYKIHAPGGIRTHNLSRRAAADLRLRPRCHWDRQHECNVCKLRSLDLREIVQIILRAVKNRRPLLVITATLDFLYTLEHDTDSLVRDVKD